MLFSLFYLSPCFLLLYTSLPTQPPKFCTFSMLYFYFFHLSRQTLIFHFWDFPPLRFSIFLHFLTIKTHLTVTQITYLFISNQLKERIQKITIKTSRAKLAFQNTATRAHPEPLNQTTALQSTATSQALHLPSASALRVADLSS